MAVSGIRRLVAGTEPGIGCGDSGTTALIDEARADSDPGEFQAPAIAGITKTPNPENGIIGKRGQLR